MSENTAKRDPLISVIIPMYNVSNYFQRCADSIMNQTEADYQAIIIDDGSTDDSASQGDELAYADERFIVIHKKNGGQANARNVGLEFIDGKYIAFCDSDDYIRADMFEKALRKIQDENAEMVRFRFCMVSETSEMPQLLELDKERIKFRNDRQRYSFLKEFLSYRYGWELCNAFYAAEPIKRQHIQFLNGVNVAEDLYFNTILIQNITTISFLNEPLYYYYRHSDSTMGRLQGRIDVDAQNRMAQNLYFGLTNDYLIKRFCVLHGLMISNELLSLPRITLFYDGDEYKQQYKKIEDKQFLTGNMRMFLRLFKDEFVEIFGREIAAERIRRIEYLLEFNNLHYLLDRFFFNVKYFPIRVKNKLKRIANRV